MSMESGENVEKPKKKSLGKYCVAGGPRNVSCTNNSRTEGISMLVFRRDDVTREKRSIRAKTSGKMPASKNISTVFRVF